MKVPTQIKGKPLMIFDSDRKPKWNGEVAFYFTDSIGIPVDMFEERCNSRWSKLSQDDRVGIIEEGVKEYLQRTGKKSWND